MFTLHPILSATCSHAEQMGNGFVFILATPRLTLRRLVPDDLNSLYALYRDPDVRRYFPDGTLDREQTRKELEWFQSGHPRDPRLGLWATIHKGTGAFIGRCGLLPWAIDGRAEVEVAFLLDKSFWGQGLATEAARAIVRYGQHELGLTRMICLIDPDNLASRNVAEKIGMRLERELEGVDGDGIPTLLYSLSRAYSYPMTHAKPRARDLGVPFDGTPGPWNAITDVAGVEVGHVTLIRDEPAHGATGPASVRTGVTAIHPLGKGATDAVLGGWFSLNGNGEMTGTTSLDEFGTIFGPLAITNTLSVGLVRDAAAAWARKHVGFGHAMVAETWDGQLNDIFGFHVTREHVHEALGAAASGPVAEGNVGGGTGMTSYDFKAGIGTSSRRVETELGTYTVGVLVQSNYGQRPQLRIAGVPVGREISELMPDRSDSSRSHEADAPEDHGDGSIIAIVATDAPLLQNQLRALAKRVSLGLGRLGSIASHSSGDIFLACSTANRIRYDDDSLVSLAAVPAALMDPLYAATVEATEESVVNALIAAETMSGANGVTFHALPHDRLREVLARYGRLRE